jgi:arginase
VIIPALAENPPPGTVALLGVPWDERSSFLRGPAEAPARVREVIGSGASHLCAERGHDLAADPRFVDAGDVEGCAGPDAPARIEIAVAALLARGVRVLALGGDHAITYPIVRAHGRGAGLTIVQFDAHPDLYDEFDGDRLSHACPFARVCEEGLARRLVQVGVRALNLHQRAQAERFGVEIIEMRDFRSDLELAVDGPVYVSIDLDVLDPAFAPGVSHHEPGGLSVRDLVRVVQDLRAPIVGADVVELNPRRDRDGVTAAVAFKLVKELAARMLSE